MRIFYIVITCFIMSGCSKSFNNNIFEKIVPKKTEILANKCIGLVKEKKLEKAIDLFIIGYRNKKTFSVLEKISERMNSGALKSQELIDWSVNIENNNQKITILYFQQNLSGKWLILSVAILNDKLICGMHSVILDKSIHETNAFSLKNKNFSQILFFSISLLISLFSLFTLIVCFVTKLKRRKWLWIVFIALGVGKIAMNWNSGQIFFNLIHLQLLNFGIIRQGVFNPWIISTSVPLGAILFWIFKKKMTKPCNNIGDPVVKEKTDEAS